MGIFTRDCPICAATHPITAVKCGCGYCFDPNKLDGVTQELEVIAQEEKLYSEYLAARAQQAEEAMKVAKMAAAVDPTNNVKKAEALLAEQAALAARAELDAQVSRARAVKERIKVVRAGRRSRRAAKPQSAPSQPAPASIRNAIAPPSPPAPAKSAPAASAPTPANRAAKPKTETVHAKKPAPAPEPRAAAVPAAPQRPAVTAPRVAAPAKKSPAPATPVPKLSPTPTPEFRTTQANKAAGTIMLSARASAHECPNCTATLKPGVKRCGCGFEVSAGENQIPALALSPEERAAFLAALMPPGGNSEGNT